MRRIGKTVDARRQQAGQGARPEQVAGSGGGFLESEQHLRDLPVRRRQRHVGPGLCSKTVGERELTRLRGQAGETASHVSLVAKLMGMAEAVGAVSNMGWHAALGLDRKWDIRSRGAINQPLGLTVYCWRVPPGLFARECKCHASAFLPCPASGIRGRDGDFGREPWRLPDHVRHHGIDLVEGPGQPNPRSGPDADPRRAVEVYGERYRANPKDADAALRYGQALRAIGQRAQAVAVFEQATIAHSGNRALLAGYGRALADNGNFQRASTC